MIEVVLGRVHLRGRLFSKHIAWTHHLGRVTTPKLYLGIASIPCINAIVVVCLILCAGDPNLAPILSNSYGRLITKDYHIFFASDLLQPSIREIEAPYLLLRRKGRLIMRSIATIAG